MVQLGVIFCTFRYQTVSNLIIYFSEKYLF